MYKLAPELVPQMFTGEKTVARILLTGPITPLTFIEGGRLVATVNGERLYATDIAWCLHYGNWPKYPLVQLDGDPFNCSITNIMPARVKRLRYVQKERGGLYYHSMSRGLGCSTPAECRLDWSACAREHYMLDLPYVLREEREERERRRASGAPAVAIPERIVQRNPKPKSTVVKPLRPESVEGMEWHWWEGVWTLVPHAVHVSDDYMNRLRAWARGAVRAEYQPMHVETWYFSAEGAVVR